MLAFLGLEPATAQVVMPERTPFVIDQFVQQLMDSAHIPGLSVAIIQANRLQYSQGYGLTAVDSSQRVTSATVFDAASLSKPVFAYAVLQLVDEGVLSLDTPLFNYLPYPDIASDERYKQITTRMVLSHQTGFPNWRKNRKSKVLSLVFTPGQRFGYSGEGFVYLQKVVQKLTGKPLDELMRERVFGPLQMTRSSYIWNPAFDTNFALPHDESGQVEPKGKPEQPNVAYSLQTTADDYARFVVAILTGSGLKLKTADQMLSRQIQLPKKITGEGGLSTTLSWGLGFGLEHTPAGDYFWHWGDNGSYKCYVTASREHGNALVYFTNSANGLTISLEMVTHFLGGDHPAPEFLGYAPFRKDSPLPAAKH